jgi:hypothetical protein
MLGKSLWKMYYRGQKDIDIDPSIAKSVPSVESILKAFTRAIETVPKPRDSRAEPIFEPHYKLMSVAHKLVLSEGIKPQDAADLLQKQPYAIRKGDAVEVSDEAAWKEFILESIRHLKNADKSNWHHRMINRVARILSPVGQLDVNNASEARTEFMKSMFTKTMVVQVWKPDNERYGRHCVYMTRYVRFMSEILLVLEDKPNMEAMAKRVRKKQADYFEFGEVWNLITRHYLILLRRAGNIPPNQDDLLKSIPSEEFSAVSDVLNAWCNDPDSSHPALDCLRETMELRRINAPQAKPPAMEDLISDAFAVLYLEIGVKLPRPVSPPMQSPPLIERTQGPMSLNSMVSNMDGSTDPVQPQIQTQPTSQAPEATRRIRGPSRKEIIRRAEGAVLRVPEQKSFPVRPQQSLTDGFVLKSNTDDSRRESLGANPSVLRLQEAGEDAEQSSAPGSVHDSADDESDLSDVPEDMDDEPAPMFPNLARSTGAVTPSEEDGGSVGGDEAA